MRNTDPLAYKLDALRIVLGKKNKASSEEHKPHKCRDKTEDVIERQECKIVDIELGIVLDRLVFPYDIFTHLNLKTDCLAAV